MKTEKTSRTRIFQFVGPTLSRPPACLLPSPTPLPRPQVRGAWQRESGQSLQGFSQVCVGLGPLLTPLSTWSPGQRLISGAGRRLLQSLLGPLCTFDSPEPCVPPLSVCGAPSLQVPAVSGSLQFLWQSCSWGRGRSPGCGLPSAGGDHRVLSPALQASRTGFPSLAWRVPTCSPSRPLSGLGASSLQAPALACPSACLMENSHHQTKLKNQSFPEAARTPWLGLALPSAHRPRVCPSHSTSTTVPRGRVSSPSGQGLPEGLGLTPPRRRRAITELVTNADYTPPPPPCQTLPVLSG